MKILDFNNGEMKLEKMQFLDNGHLSLAGTDIVSEKVVDFISREYPGIFCCNRFGAGDVQFASAKME